MAIEDVIDRLKAQLLTSGLSQKDNATFQVINQLIDALRGVISGSISSGSSGGGGLIATAPIVTWGEAGAILPNSRQLIPGDGIELNNVSPPQRRLIIESQRRTSIISTESERGMRGPQGIQGIQGLQGPIGPRGFSNNDDNTSILLPRPITPDANIITITDTGSVNDYDFLNADVVICNNASTLTITGLKAGKRGQLVRFFSINSSGPVLFSYNSGSSSAANRLLNAVQSGPTPIYFIGSCIVYQYDGSIWRLINHNQGSVITPTFAAGYYTANGGGGGWTVAAGNVAAMSYLINERSINVSFIVNTSTVVGAANTELRRVVPGGYTINGENVVANLRVFSGAAWQIGYFYGAAGATFLRFFYDLTGGTNWPVAAGNTYIQGNLQFGIQ